MSRLFHMLDERDNPLTAGAETLQHPLRTSDLDYLLPPHLIATRPIEGERDLAQMMVVSRSDPSLIEHRRVRDLPAYLRPGDALVFNTSAVARARLAGRRAGTGGRVDGLFLSSGSVQASKRPNVQIGGQRTAASASTTWHVMLRSNSRLRVGDRIELVDAHDDPTGVVLELRERGGGGPGGEWIVGVDPPVAPEETIALLERIGRTPLPPYILRARGMGGRQTAFADELDRKWYETVYADPSRDRRCSVAAPTAGLHFTPDLLARLDDRGVRRLRIVLHVGAGTFKPVTAATLDQHVMHSEWYEVPAETIESLSSVRAPQSETSRRTSKGQDPTGQLKAESGNSWVIAVGTTAVRTLESLPDLIPRPPGGAGATQPITGTTDLMIAPPYTFRHVDGMLTNFHLPRSSLLALVAAMVGVNRVKALYAEAIDREYRFYSYGDCMLILP